MVDLFYNALKWYISVIFLILGVFCVLQAQELSSVKFLMPAVLSFGAAYILLNVWCSLNRALVFSTFGVGGMTAFLSLYFSDIAYVLTGYIVSLDFFLAWMLLMFILGLPFMMWAFKKFG